MDLIRVVYGKKSTWKNKIKKVKTKGDARQLAMEF